MVRGLALRSLSSLRMESLLEYVEQPMKRAFTDISPYVRKTGVMAVLKVRYDAVVLHCKSCLGFYDEGWLVTTNGNVLCFNHPMLYTLNHNYCI